MRVSRLKRSTAAPKAQPPWAELPDSDLLQLRLKDLKVSIHGTWLEERLDELNDALAARKLLVRAHGWLSDEWFSPHATPGIAFPFYLAHPRLARLERKMMLDVEGGTKRECMRLLRHEAGHVVQYGYGLHRRWRWQTLFGRASTPYPDSYRPNPASKDYVQHLRRWYAQCHPDEDFAETFAVWLTPRSAWRQRYADWPALEKLMYVDEVMNEIADAKPLAKKRIEIDPIGGLTMTLAEHYRQKLARYSVDAQTVFDRDLKRIFSCDPREGPLAATFIRANRTKIRRLVAKWMGDNLLPVEAAMDDMIDRCRALNLHVAGSELRARQELTVLLTTHKVHSHYSSSGRRSFAV